MPKKSITPDKEINIYKYFFEKKLQIKEIALLLDVSPPIISKYISKYLHKNLVK